VVVVEAELRSGSLSTARACREQGRVLAAYPGSPGCDRLLASGAALVEAPEDALAALAGTPRHAPVPPLDPIAERVRAAIAGGARGVDAIARATGLPVRAVLRALPGLPSISARCT
jgi:DNA processing protein